MTEQQQAELLARWLEDGGSPPEGLDIDAVESMIALRSDLQPPVPVLSLDDVLAGVTEGPFAQGASAAAVADRMPVGASLGGSPEEAPAAGSSARRRPWWIAAVGVGGFGSLVAAAAVLVVVGGTLVTGSLPSLEGLNQAAAPAERAPVAASSAPAADAAAFAPVDTGQPRDLGRARAVAKSKQEEKTLDDRVAAAPTPPPLADPSPAVAARPSPRPAPAAAPPREPIPELAARDTRIAAGTVADRKDAQNEDVVAFAEEEAGASDEAADLGDLDDLRRSADDAAEFAATANTGRGFDMAPVGTVAEAGEMDPYGGAPATEPEPMEDDARAQQRQKESEGRSMSAEAKKESRARPAKTRASADAPARPADLEADGVAAPAAPQASVPPPPPPGAAPARESTYQVAGPSAQPGPSSAAAHQGSASVTHPDVSEVRALLATDVAGALAATQRLLPGHPEPTAVRQELLALQGDALYQLGQLPAARQAWQAAIAVRDAR